MQLPSIERVKRSTIRKFVHAAQAGEAPLRVLGSTASGFRLGVETPNGIIPFGHSFPKQTLAVCHGEQRFGRKPKKLVAKT